jgi:hypothetical protein
MAGSIHSGASTERQHAPLVARDPGVQRITPDRSGWFFPDEDDLAESFKHMLIVKLFTACVERLLKHLACDDVVGGNIFFAWLEGNPKARLAPDMFISPAGSVPLEGVVETWAPGQKPPRFALEVVSEDMKKDYEHAPAQYGELGVDELVVFDPAANRSRSSQRRLLAVYRRQTEGALTQVAAGRGPVYSTELGVWLIPKVLKDVPYLRISRDEAGADLILTAEEEADRALARVRELEARLASRGRARKPR